MLDWVFALFVLLASGTTILSVLMRMIRDTYWNITLIPVSVGLWLFLGLFTASGIQTPYVAYNETLGNSTLYYGVYAPEEFIYLSYFFLLMALLNVIYLLVTIFGYYYEQLDRKNDEKEQEAME